MDALSDRWEYTTLTIGASEWGYADGDFDALLRFGAEGWEAFAVTREERHCEIIEDEWGNASCVVYHLKRRVVPRIGEKGQKR